MLALGPVLAVGLLSGVLLLGTLLTVLWWRDRCDQEPVSALVAAFAWGAFAAALTGLVIQRWAVVGQDWPLGGGSGRSLASLLLLAAVAQTLLAIGVALLARRVDGPTDGMLVGCAAGLGWGICEAVVEAVRHLAAGGEASTPALPILLLLVVAGVGGGAVATGVFGGLLGLARFARGLGSRILWTAGGLAVAILLDAGWRWSRGAARGADHGWVTGLLLLGLVVAIYGLLLWLLLRAEGRVLADELEEELAWGVVPAWVVSTIPSYRSRVRGDWWPDRRTRVVVARLLSRLALRKRAVRVLPPAAAALAALEVGKLRSRARAVLLPDGPDEE